MSDYLGLTEQKLRSTWNTLDSIENPLAEFSPWKPDQRPGVIVLPDRDFTSHFENFTVRGPICLPDKS